MSSPTRPFSRLRRLVRSFCWAGRGFYRCLWRERNLRIHLIAAAGVLWLGGMLGLGRGEFVLLLLCCAGVISAELFNTALEEMTDLLSPDYRSRAGYVKDVAAAGVLCAALFSAGCGAILLWRPKELLALLAWLWKGPPRLLALLAAAALGALFIFLPEDKPVKERGAQYGRSHTDKT